LYTPTFRSKFLPPYSESAQFKKSAIPESKNGAISPIENSVTDHQQILGHAPKDMNPHPLHSEEPMLRTFGTSSLKHAPAYLIYVLCNLCLVFLGTAKVHSKTGHEGPEGNTRRGIALLNL
jgi:hypothetical protein